MKAIIYLAVGIGLMIGSMMKGWTQDGEPDINAYVHVDTEPKPQNISDVRKSIGYPEEAVNEDAQGTVVARILVDESGRYVKHKIVQKVHPKLAEAVEAKLPEITFDPAMSEGKPVKYWINIPFPFKLLNNEDIIRQNIEKLTQELEAEPDNYEIWHKRGIQRSSIQLYDDAITDFTESININPKKNKKKKRKNTYEFLVYAHYSRGAAYFQQEKYEEAVKDYQTALSLAEEMAVPDSGVEATIPTLYIERGYMYSAMEKYTEAKADFQHVLAKYPDQKCIVYPLLRDIGLAEENNEELVTYYEGIISCDSSNIIQYYSLGYYKLQAGDAKGSISDFTLVAEKHASTPLRIASYNMAAMAYLEMKDYEKAHKEIEKALKINVLNPQSSFFQGKIYLAEGDTKAACKSLQKAVDFGIDGDDLKQIEELQKTHCGLEE